MVNLEKQRNDNLNKTPAAQREAICILVIGGQKVILVT